MSNKAKTNTMNRKAKQALKPKRRFPEFAGKPLHAVRIGDVTAESTIRNADKLPATSVMGVRKGEGIVPMEERLVASDISRYKLVQKDWFAYNPMRLNIGSIGRYHHNADVLVSPDYMVFRCLEEDASPNISPEYLDHYRESDQWDAFVTEAGDGGVRIRIYYQDIAQLRLTVPDKDEQQRIADCLTSLDELIAAHGRKLDALKTHKKGLMQNLFPRQGETQPHLRFPEFRDKPKWREIPLGELLSQQPEYGVNAAAAPYSDDLPTYLRITDIEVDGRFKRENKVSVDIDATNSNYLIDGDIVLARTGASVGKSYRYRKEDGRLVFAGFLIRVRPNPKKLVPTFLSNYLTTWQYWDWVRVTSARSGQPGINGSEYATLPVSTPHAGSNGNILAEQRRIADCLCSLDALVSAQTQKIDALKTHKKGLMQQLFPSEAEESITP